MSLYHYSILGLISIVLISKEYIYISDEFLVIFSFILIVVIFFNKLSTSLASTLDEYSEKVSLSARELVKTQQNVLLEFKEYQLELITLQQRIKYLIAYLLEKMVDISDVCEHTYYLNIEAYLNNKLISLLLHDIDYYEYIYSEISAKEIDTLITNQVLFGESETVLQPNIFFPFVDSEAV